MYTSFVSVIIPVFNDSERLKLCLQALENQTYSKNLYELIVVDNASQQEIKSLVIQFSQAKLTYESQPGSYIARNQGISIAKGEILAFTDSDCIPASDWIEKGVKNLLSTPNCGLVAGRIDFFFKNPKKLTPVELYENIEMPFNQELNVQETHFGVTANLFTFKHVIDNVGSFDEKLKSGGDREWGERVFQAGYQQIYADDTHVKHPARNSFSQLYKRIARFEGGKYDLMVRKNISSFKVVISLLYALIPPFKAAYKAWKNSALKGVRQKMQFIIVIFFVRYVIIIERIRLYLGGNSRRD
ncbi:glycosyltransferase [Nostocaceae cyanobacterium CENA369]|uniref:Glycosyltransferase n=1 Tax=Dendronalium phyllosphericum CENA369 TaxID=1725256 RepID=A0A8J7I110_9NOST|nr:glycosyltransferase [Dendronalium phyllosphericum]MBH8571523.1 glycosyltransferase [Dendronalium phyllosphericum CENA369]